MKHFGDITKVNGAEVPTVDIITGGSPCQDLSVAGKRAGLAGERSGLFMEQMRIVKEMRERDRANGRTGWMVRPRYMVWENVPGAFSSGTPKGADFAAVIEEIIKVAEPGASVSVCVPNGGYPKSGCYYAEDGAWSIAWRLHDAQFWGVPQRRKRIALVADFGGLSAPEILFERKGLSRDSEPCGEAGQETAGAAGGGVDGAEPILLESNQNHATVQTDGISTALPASMGMGGGYVPMVTAYGIDQQGVEGAIFYDAYQHHGWRRSETSGTLTVGQNNTVRGDTPLVAACGISSYDSNAMKSSNPHSGIYEADTARTLDLNGGSPACNQGGIAVVQPVVGVNGDIAGTLDANYYKGCGERQGVEREVVVQPAAVCVGNGQLNQMSMAEQANTLDTMHDQQAVMCFQNTGRGWWNESDVGATIRTPCGGDSTKANLTINNAIVRRLTPLECERLQGYPDGWTDIGEWVDSKGKKHKDADSPRYKALGNSIALPFWQWLAKRISAQYERTPTMASLFDGIGGFPLVFARAGTIPVWASEIEEFPIAVTKIRFPEEEQL